MIRIRKCLCQKNYRIFARIVSYFQFWLNCVYSYMVVSRYIDYWNIPLSLNRKLLTSYEKRIYEHKELIFDLGQFSELSSCFLIMYSCCLLKKATNVVHYRHLNSAQNLLFIRFWMVVHCFNLVSSFVCYTVASLRIGESMLFTAGTLMFVLNSCMLRIVFKFYTEEVAVAAVNSNQNAAPTHTNINVE